MLKKFMSLLVVWFLVMPGFGAEVSFKEELPSSGMEAMKLLTMRLQQSLVVRNNENVLHYAKPLASLIMDGRVRKILRYKRNTSQSVARHYRSWFPQYEKYNITKIVEGKSYGFLKTRTANSEERETYYNALSTLAYTSVYADHDIESSLLKDLSAFLENIIVIEGPELEDKDNSNIAHRRVAFDYYEGMRRNGHHRGWERLKFLDTLIDKAVGSGSQGYENSPYAGVVHIGDTSIMSSIKANIPWIKRIEEGKSRKEDSGPVIVSMNKAFKKHFPHFSACSWTAFFRNPEPIEIRGSSELLVAYQEALGTTLTENKEVLSLDGPEILNDIRALSSNIGMWIEADRFFVENRGGIYETLKKLSIIDNYRGVQRGLNQYTLNSFTVFSSFNRLLDDLIEIWFNYLSRTIPLSEQQLEALKSIFNKFEEYEPRDSESKKAFKEYFDKRGKITQVIEQINKIARTKDDATLNILKPKFHEEYSILLGRIRVL